MQTTLMKRFHTYFKKNEGKMHNYSIPDLWQRFAYDAANVTYLKNGEVLVDPHRFFKVLLENVYLDHGSINKGSLSQKKGVDDDGAWLKDSVIYSSLIRTSSAWDHDRSGYLEDENLQGLNETGTFLKMLCLLPFLKDMGINTLYLLPIMRYSKYEKKGDLGSPYGVKDFFSLDPALQDCLTKDAFSIDEEFSLLVEAAHALNMRVMIDIIPRTNAIDSELIKEHPEWFYWIKADQKSAYTSPYIKGIHTNTTPKEKYLDAIYKSPSTKKHIALFDVDPKRKDPEAFAQLKDSDNFLEAIEKTFNLTIAPAFSDNINDPQPPWSDVTFFRLFFDHPTKAKPYLKKDTPPYILFDTIKANLYPGEKPNLELWERIASVIPHFQKNYGIDGARIDMGHALPRKLLDMIIKNAKALDPDFGFIAEELNPEYAADAKEKGYNIMIGDGFIHEPRIFTGNAKEFFTENNDLPIPFFAAPETHDTPRIAAREGGEILSKTLLVLNLFTPNAVPFINSGLEIFESQAMNLGLDASEKEMKRLMFDDPYYNKLALFDRYQLHYTYQKRFVLPAILKTLAPLREKMLPVIKNKSAFKALKSDNDLFVGLSYTYEDKLFLVLGNLNPFHEEKVYPSIAFFKSKSNKKMQGKLLFSTNEAPRAFTQFIDENTLDIHLAPGEVKIVEI